ncbi:hypothetical protein [Chryseobacterium sp. M5A1_1a]
MDGISGIRHGISDDWSSDVNIGLMGRFYTATGIIDDKNFSTKYKGLSLSLKKNTSSIIYGFRGSLCKFFTDGKTNAIDFTRLDLLQTIEKLKKELYVDPEMTEIRSFEYCAIIKCPFNIDYLKNSILTHKRKNYSLLTEKGKEFGFIFKHQRYHFKIYFKDFQEKKEWNNRLKIEVAIKKMIFVDGFGIKNLSDLTKELVWEKLSELLLKLWNEIVFVEKDNYTTEKMRPHERTKLQCFLNSNYWSNLTLLNDKNFYKAKQRLEVLNTKYLIRESGKDIISKLLKEKCVELIKSGEKLTCFEKFIEKDDKRVFNHLDNRFISILNSDKEKNKIVRKCKNISCQNELTSIRKNVMYCTNECRIDYYKTLSRIKKKLFGFATKK